MVLVRKGDNTAINHDYDAKPSYPTGRTVIKMRLKAERNPCDSPIKWDIMIFTP